MTDVFSKEMRSLVMRSVKSKRTSLEDSVTKELWKRGLRFRRNVSDLAGTPDIAIKKYHIVIFIDSCFWHGCPQHGEIPKSNAEYWSKKFERNMNRDQNVNEYYMKKGWNILRIWEHDLKSDFEGTVLRIISFVNKHKN